MLSNLTPEAQKRYNEELNRDAERPRKLTPLLARITKLSLVVVKDDREKQTLSVKDKNDKDAKPFDITYTAFTEYLRHIPSK